MLETLARRRLEAFARDWNYDTAYLREILEAGGLEALAPVGNLQKLTSYRRDVPLAPYTAAKLVAARAADCGPCVQLGVTMAERAGVDPALVRAVLQRDPDALDADARLAYDFAEASLARDPSADALRERVVGRWGKRGLISLAYAMASVQIYPTIKYALGYGHACARVRVGGADLPVPALAPA
jgi:alkylhydroperoxidase family enzyme